MSCITISFFEVCFFLVDQLNDLLDKHVFDSQRPGAGKTNTEHDESDEYGELHSPSSSLPPTPSVKRTYKGTSSVSQIYFLNR